MKVVEVVEQRGGVGEFEVMLMISGSVAEVVEQRGGVKELESCL